MGAGHWSPLASGLLGTAACVPTPLADVSHVSGHSRRSQDPIVRAIKLVDDQRRVGYQLAPSGAAVLCRMTRCARTGGDTDGGMPRPASMRAATAHVARSSTGAEIAVIGGAACAASR